MYTISLRPNIPHSVTNKCINFEQERAAWAMSSFTEHVDAGTESVLGLVFYTPLEGVDITVPQLAAMMAGLDVAYEELCNMIYKDAPNALASTPYKTVDMFMDCIPRGIHEMEPDAWPVVYKSDTLPLPILYAKEKVECLVWTGRTWGLMAPPDGIDSYDSAGACFGWDVKYKADCMETSCVHDPKDLCHMMASLLSSLAYLNTDAKIYVQNLYSVQ